MTKSQNITPAAVAASVVKAGRSFVSAREAAATASCDYRAAAMLTADALRTGVTAKAVSEALRAAIGDDRALAREVQSSIAYVTMLARVGRVLALAGDMPRMPARKGEAASDADTMGPRDVYTLIRAAQQHKGGAAAIDAATEQETIAAAVDAIRAFVARATRKAAATAEGAEGGTESAEGGEGGEGAEGGALAVQPDASTLLREAAASVEAAATIGPLAGDALALALALADRLADILDTVSAEDVTTARATLAA